MPGISFLGLINTSMNRMYRTKNYLEDYGIEELEELLFERKGGRLTLKRSGLSKVSTTAVFAKIKMIQNQISRTKDLSKKIDLLSKMNFYMGLLMTISSNSEFRED